MKREVSMFDEDKTLVSIPDGKVCISSPVPTSLGLGSQAWVREVLGSDYVPVDQQVVRQALLIAQTHRHALPSAPILDRAIGLGPGGYYASHAEVQAIIRYLEGRPPGSVRQMEISSTQRP